MRDLEKRFKDLEKRVSQQTMTLHWDNHYDGQEMAEYEVDEFWSIVRTGKYGIIQAHEIQRDILNGTIEVIEGRSLSVEEIKRRAKADD